MMFGMRDEFPYRLCSKCGSLQIESTPSNLGKYYPREKYYSFTQKRSITGDQISKISFQRNGMLYRILKHLLLLDPNMDAIGRINISRTARILDVGSGSGSTLLKLRSFGYNNVIGIDPYIAKETQEPIEILKKNLSELDPDCKFDLIMFLHSFEHVHSPLEILLSAKDLLDDNGTIVIRTPIVSDAFDKYREFWFQIDAPRHIVIFSEHGLNIIIDRAGLEIVDSYYDSTDAQFVYSEGYKHNIAWRERQTSPIKTVISKTCSANVRKAKKLNLLRRGDQGVFYIRKRQ